MQVDNFTENVKTALKFNKKHHEIFYSLKFRRASHTWLQQITVASVSEAWL